jgi:hypothetical protein
MLFEDTPTNDHVQHIRVCKPGFSLPQRMKRNLLTRKIQPNILSTLSIALCSVIFVPDSAFSQADPPELIVDGGFEVREPNINGDTLCPSFTSFIGILKYWDSARGSVDYFHSCSNDQYPNFGVPSNLYGYQATRYSGNAYAGLGCYTPVYNDAREFVTTELSEPLVANRIYRLSFYLSLADSMNYAVGKLGAYFSPTQTRGLPADQYFEFDPQIKHESILSDKENWTLISGEFVAEGDEKFLTIGSFWRDDEMSIEQVGTETNGIASIYYLDDVFLEDLGEVGIEESPLTKFKLFPNPVNKDGWFTVDHDLTSDSVEFVMFNLMGIEVKRVSLPSRSTQVDLGKHGLSCGAYSYQLMVEGNSVGSGKIFIQ